MPRTKSGAGPGQIPLFSNFYRPGPGQVRGKLLVVWGRSGASFLAGTRHGFV